MHTQPGCKSARAAGTGLLAFAELLAKVSPVREAAGATDALAATMRSPSQPPPSANALRRGTPPNMNGATYTAGEGAVGP